MFDNELKTKNNQQSDVQTKKEPFFSQEGQSSFFSESKGNSSSFFNQPNIQAKLTVGQPNDKYEKEADVMADAVVNKSSSTPQIQNKNISSIQRESLATPLEDEKLGTAEQRMEEDKLVQEKLVVQKKCSDYEEEIFQPKLDVGEPNDPYEKEANKIGAQVMNSFEDKPIIQNKEKESERQSLKIQSKLSLNDSFSSEINSSNSLSKIIDKEKGNGASMDASTKNLMEANFNADFSNVKIHTGRKATELSENLGAHAFTSGGDIFFNEGRYVPNTKEGAGLLAHELVHTVQQGTVKQNKREGNSKLQELLSKYGTAHLVNGNPQIHKEKDLEKLLIPSKVDEVQKKDSSLSLRRCSCNRERTEEEEREIEKEKEKIEEEKKRKKLLEEFKEKRKNPPPTLLSKKLSIGNAAVSLSQKKVVMDSYQRFQDKEKAQGDLVWGFFFSKDKTLNAATKKPDTFNTWEDFKKMSARQRSTLFQISRITGEVVHNRYSETKSNLTKLKKAFNYWPSSYYAVHQSGSKEASNTCNVFVGGSLYGAGYKGNNKGKLWSANQIYQGADGNFVEIDKAYTMPGDIAAYGGTHVGVVVKVDVENEIFITREGYIKPKGRERNRSFDELLGLDKKHKPRIMRKK